METKKNLYADIEIRDYKDELALIKDFVQQSNKTGSEHFVHICGKADFIYVVFKTLLIRYGYAIGYMDYSRSIFDSDYNKEYYISIYDYMITVDKAYTDNGKPYNMEGTIFFYQEDCNQKLIDKALQNENHVVLFGFGCDDSKTLKYNVKYKQDKIAPSDTTHTDDKGIRVLSNDYKVDCSTDSDGKMHGFTIRRTGDDSCFSYSYYTTEDLNPARINNILDKIII